MIESPANPPTLPAIIRTKALPSNDAAQMPVIYVDAPSLATILFLIGFKNLAYFIL